MLTSHVAGQLGSGSPESGRECSLGGGHMVRFRRRLDGYAAHRDTDIVFYLHADTSRNTSALTSPACGSDDAPTTDTTEH